jgi:hypothetical protein
MTAKINPIAHLVNTLQSEGDILIFLGAGSSTEGSQDDAPFPDFETLIGRVLRDEGIDVTASRADDFLEVLRRWERESVLSVRLASYLYGNPGISHLQLASVTMSLFPTINMTIYLTTNFDDLMFKALSSLLVLVSGAFVHAEKTPPPRESHALRPAFDAPIMKALEQRCSNLVRARALQHLMAP